MSGNVSEMVESEPYYQELYICGGSWISNPQECSSSSYKEITPQTKKSHIGFRLAY
jgi:formylglycine-generating enzyme required for sulfatase activity